MSSFIWSIQHSLGPALFERCMQYIARDSASWHSVYLPKPLWSLLNKLYSKQPSNYPLYYVPIHCRIFYKDINEN